MNRRTLLLAVVALLALPGVAGAQVPDLNAKRKPVPAGLPSDGEIFRTIEEITAKGPRRLGMPGGPFAVNYVKGKFEQYGLQDVHVEETPAWSWEARGHRLTYGGREIPSSPAVYSQSPSARAVGDFDTPAGGLASPLVDIRSASAQDIGKQDLKGKIVLFDLDFQLPLAGLLAFSEFMWDPGNTLISSPRTLTQANPYITNFSSAVKAAQDAGAAGFVGVLGDYFDSHEYNNEFYRRLVVKIPGMWVTKAEGAKLRAQLAADPATPMNLVLKTTRAEKPASVVVGVLPGQSKDAIMVQSHHDSGHTGAVEDGSGVAEVLALAKYYAAQPASSRKKTLMFTTFDSHFTGYQAHFAFVKRHILDRDPARDPYRIVANVTLEHIAKAGLIGDDGKLEISDLPEPRGIFENFNPVLKADLMTNIVRNDLRRMALLNGTVLQPVGLPTDASGIATAGIPTASLISGPIYLYDAADTLDKVAKTELQRVAQSFVEFVDTLDESDSETIGVTPLTASLAVGREAVKGVTGERGTEVSTDRVEAPLVTRCRTTSSGRAVTGARLRPVAGVTHLTFLSRRAQSLRITLRYRSGRTVVVQRLLKIRGCRRYQVRLPGTVTRVTLSGRGGPVTARLAR